MISRQKNIAFFIKKIDETQWIFFTNLSLNEIERKYNEILGRDCLTIRQKNPPQVDKPTKTQITIKEKFEGTPDPRDIILDACLCVFAIHSSDQFFIYAGNRTDCVYFISMFLSKPSIQVAPTHWLWRSMYSTF